MSVKSKLDDLVLLIKKDKKYQFFTILLIGFIAVSFIYGDNGNRRKRAKRPQETGAGAMGKNEVKIGVKKNSERTEELAENLTSMEERTSQIFKKILERMESDAAARNANNNILPADVDGGQDNSFDPEPDTLETFGALDTPVIAPPPPPSERRIAYIGAGDSVRVKLLSGVNAPTDGTPYPVVFKLMSDVDGPDGSALPLGEARLIAAAQGSLTDSRALFRLHTMNIRYPNGRRKVVDVDGWIVGEDGLRGMSGILIDPLGKAIAAQGVVGAVGAAGEALAANNINTFIDRNGNAFSSLNGDVAEYGIGKGISGATNEWREIIKDRVDDMVPAVQVYSGRKATAVFARSVEIKGLYEELETEEDIFTSLD
jgi:hypothetical protein